METLTLTISLPKDVGVGLENKARLRGQDAAGFNVKPIHVIKNILDIDEIQAVIHDHFSTFFFVPNDRPIKSYI